MGAGPMPAPIRPAPTRLKSLVWFRASTYTGGVVRKQWEDFAMKPRALLVCLALLPILCFLGCSDDESNPEQPLGDPIADAGEDQFVFGTGSTVPLDGSGSVNVRTYLWAFVTRPTGSAATFSSADAQKPTFFADVYGEYQIELTTNNGSINSDPDTVKVTVSVVNTPALIYSAAEGCYSPSWSPNGSRIAFACGADSALSIWSIAPDGSGALQLTDDTGSDNLPDWNATTTRIYFESNRSGMYQLYWMNSDGSSQTQIDTGQFNDRAPDISPDGAKIVFQSQGTLKSNIWIMNTDGSGLVRLTNDAGNNAGPVISPNGAKIVFWSDRTGNQEIFSMDIDGTDQVQLTHTDADEGHPHFSPDGTQIVYWSMRTGNRDVWIMDLNGANQYQITSDPGDDGGGNWNPNGTIIIFRSDRSGTNAIWRMSL